AIFSPFASDYSPTTFSVWAPPFPFLLIVSERSSPSRVRSAAPNAGAPLTAPGRSGTRPEIRERRACRKLCGLNVRKSPENIVEDYNEVMHLLKMMLKATGEKGVPQGGVISPLLSNLYLTEVDRMLEKAIATTRRGEYTNVQYARLADDLVILIDAHPRHDWLVKAGERRLREGLAKLQVAINEDKSRMGNPAKGESFSFLGFEYRRIRSRNGVWRPYDAPKLKKRTALFAKLREVFRRHVSQPVGEVVEMINPIRRGWVHYFRIGDSSRCFSMVKRWVEKKVRRHLMRASK